MATIIQILIFAVAMLVFFYPMAAMFCFYSEDGFYRFQKDRFIFVTGMLSVLAVFMATIFVLAVPQDTSAQDVASQSQPLSVAEASLPALPVVPVVAQAQ